ncbi:hypothetical protein ACQP2Y_14905 [Actinoplanes sp. CA-051413]|uniref:hypothetical protein n=1 Tax=Actinoplanes sp. CA-051413 TaxID=3239899 RepID=UPI003D9A05DB
MTAEKVRRVRLALVQRLDTSWNDLAILIGIPTYEFARFPPGREADEIWKWLEARKRLGELAENLRDIDRPDLAEMVGDVLDAPVALPVATSTASMPSRPQRPWTLAADDDLAIYWLPRARGADPDAGGSAWRFVGRGAAVARVAAHLTAENSPRSPLTVIGEPGSGKSALLAHVLVLADPVLREQMPLRYRGPGTEALTGSVDVAVRATGKTMKDVVTAVAQAAQLEVDDAGRLVAAVHAMDTGLNIVVDALDEADPDEIRPIALLLRRLSLDPDRRGTRVVVSVRRAPTGSSLADVVRLSLAATPETTLAVDRAPYLVRQDVIDYVQRRLEETDFHHPTAYTGPDIIGRVARAVVTRAGGNFLVAQMASRNLADRPEGVDIRRRRWWAEFPVDVESAMDQYLARFGDEERYIRELLTPLAFALGDGLPDNELWVVAARALGRSRDDYQLQDLSVLLERAATYLVTTERDGVRTYRLFHDALAQYLRGRCPAIEPERALVTAWMSTSVRGIGWSSADRYLITYLARHAAAGAELDALLGDAQFVATAEPANLTWALSHVRTDDGKRVARVYRQLPVGTIDPNERAAYLALSAQQIGDLSLRDIFRSCGLTLPWSPRGGEWRPPDDHDVVARLDGRTTAADLLSAADGTAYLVSGDQQGTLWLHEIMDGIALPAVQLDPHRRRVTAVTGVRGSDGLQLLVSAADDGEMRFWQVDSGLAPTPVIHRPGNHSIVDVAVTATTGGALVAACDQQGAISLTRFSADGVTTVAETTGAHTRHVAVHLRDDTVTVVAATSDGWVRLLRPDGRGSFRADEFRIGRWSVTAIAIDEGSGVVVLGTGGREVHFYDPSTGELKTVTDAGSAGISSLSIVSGDQGGLLLGDYDGVVQYWSRDEHAGLHRQRLSRLHQDEVLTLAMIRGTTGPRAVSCGRDGKVAVWDPSAAGSDPAADVRDIDLAGSSPGEASVSVVTREDATTQRWFLGPGRALIAAGPTPGSSRPIRGTPVTGTVDARGLRRQFRSDLATSTAGGRRPIPLRPFRGVAVAAVDDETQVLAIRGDGRLDVYSADDLDTATAQIATGITQPISLSLGRLADGEAVVSCGDADGKVWVRRWSDVHEWSGSRGWPLTIADPRTAVAADGSGRDLLVTGDAAGELALWRLGDDDPQLLGARAERHTTPITAVTLAHAGAGLAAVSGDRGGTLVVSPIENGGFSPVPRRRIVLGSAVLSIAAVASAEVIVWCRQGSLIISWT